MSPPRLLCVAVVGALLSGGCSAGVQRQAATPDYHGLAPLCSHPSFGSLTPDPVLTQAVPGLRVGITLSKSMSYRVDDVRVEVLAPNARLDSAGAADPIVNRSNRPVLSKEERQVPADDREIAVVWDGNDASGNALPSGRYPVVVYVAASASGTCRSGPSSLSGVLTILDWQG